MKPKNGEFWWFQWGVSDKPNVGQIIDGKVYQTGDEEEIQFEDIHLFIKRIPKPKIQK